MFIAVHPSSMFYSATRTEAVSRAKVHVKNTGRTLVVYELTEVARIVPDSELPTPLLPPPPPKRSA
jgi:hypothetical protein